MIATLSLLKVRGIKISDSDLQEEKIVTGK
jgi:hypothetical protein